MSIKFATITCSRFCLFVRLRSKYVIGVCFGVIKRLMQSRATIVKFAIFVLSRPKELELHLWRYPSLCVVARGVSESACAYF